MSRSRSRVTNFRSAVAVRLPSCNTTSFTSAPLRLCASEPHLRKLGFPRHFFAQIGRGPREFSSGAKPVFGADLRKLGFSRRFWAIPCASWAISRELREVEEGDWVTG